MVASSIVTFIDVLPMFQTKSRKVLNLPSVFEVLVVHKAWLGRGSRYTLREHIVGVQAPGTGRAR